MQPVVQPGRALLMRLFAHGCIDDFGMGSLSAATLLWLKQVDIFGDQLLRDVVIVCLSALVITLALALGKSPSPRLRREAKERRRGRANTYLAPRLRREAKERRRGRANTYLAPSPSSPGTKHQNPPTNNTRQGLQPCMNCGWQTQFARTCSSPSSRFERSTPEPGEALPSPLDICLNNDYIARRKVYNQSVAKLLPAETGAHDAPPSTEAPPPAMSQACYQAPQEPGPKKPSAP